MHRHHDTHKRVDSFQLFADQTERDVIEAGAAILLRNADAEQIQLAHLLQHFRMKFLLLVPFFDIRRHLFLRKLAHGLHQRFMIFSQLEFNH